MNKIINNGTFKYFIGIISIMFICLTIILSIKFNMNILNFEIIGAILIILSVYLLKNEFLLLNVTIFSSFILMFFTENININQKVLYFLDYLIFLILVKLFLILISRKNKNRKILIILVAFIFISLFGILVNGASFVNYLKIIYMDYIRYFIVLLGTIYFNYSDKQIKKTFKFISIFTLLQLPIVIFQILTLDKTYTIGYVYQDYASGILGGKSTAELGGLLCIVFIVLFQLYEMRKVSRKIIYISLVVILSISVLSEIKFVLLMVPVLVFFMSLHKLSFKKIIIFICSIIFIFIGMNLIAKVNPGFENFFSKEKFENYINYSYGGSGLSRGNSLSIANSYVNDDVNKFLVGNGIGSSTKSEIQTSEFGRNNQYVFKMFYWPYVLVETGYMGIIIIIIFYASIIFMSIKLLKSKNEYRKIIGGIGVPFIVLIIVMNYYAMSMLKFNFAILVWVIFGIIIREYYNQKEQY